MMLLNVYVMWMCTDATIHGGNVDDYYQTNLVLFVNKLMIMTY